MKSQKQVIGLETMSQVSTDSCITRSVIN